MARKQDFQTIITALVVVFAPGGGLQSSLACFQYRTAYGGDDLLIAGVVDAESAEKCQEACQQNAECANWTYDARHRQCHLKGYDAQSRAAPDPLAVSGPRYCRLPSQCITPGFEYSSAADVGKVVDGSVPSPEACQRLCAQNPECAFWTYFSANRECYLKGQGAESMQPEYKPAAVSGPKYCPPSVTPTCYQANMDYIWEPKGKETVYHQSVPSAKECQKICQLNSACHFFTYIEKPQLCALGKTIRYPIRRVGATTGPKFCCPPNSTGENVEISGKHLATHKTPSYTACQQLCETNPLCSAAAYNTNSRTCVHKQTARFAEEVVSGPKHCKWLGPFSQADRAQPPGLTVAAKLPGNPSEILDDAAPNAATKAPTERPLLATEAESLCTLHGFRVHHMYRRHHNVYALQKVSHDLWQPRTAGVSIPQAHHSSEGCFHKGVEVLGTDVGTAPAQGPAACQRMCGQNELCSVFAYYTSTMLCVQRQRARWAPGFVSFEKQDKHRDADLVEPLLQENATAVHLPPIEDKCFSSGFHYEEAVLIFTQEAESAEACQTLCQKEPSCSYFTYSKTRQLCGLLQSRGRKVPNEDSVCGPKFCGVEGLTKVPGENLAHCFLTGYFYDGPSLPHVRRVVSADDCQRRCQEESNCRAFSYFRKKQLCSLLTDSGDLVEEPDAVAGPRACPPPPKRTENGNANSSQGEARWSTLRENVASAEDCRKLCAAKTFCDVFTYSARQERCLLHSGCGTVRPEESWTAGSSQRDKGCFDGAVHCESEVYAYSSGLTSAQECQRLCNTDPFCKYSTFYEKDAVHSRVQQYGGKMSEKDAIHELQFTVRQDRRQNANCLLRGTCSPEDVPPVAFKDSVLSAEECQRLCEENPLCSVFTYASVERTCKLHPEEADSQSDTAVAPPASNGLLTQTEEADCFNHGFYYNGAAVSFSLKVKCAKDCQKLCLEEPMCKFFSYFIREQMCGLLPEPGQKIPESDAICGPKVCPLGLWEAR